MAVSGKRAPHAATRRLVGASDLLLVFGVAACAIGLVIAAHGVAALLPGTAPHVREGGGRSGGEMRRDHPATQIVPVSRPNPVLPSRPQIEPRDESNDSPEMYDAIGVLRRSQSWLPEVAACYQDPCSLSSAMRGDWMPPSGVQESLPREETPIAGR